LLRGTRTACAMVIEEGPPERRESLSFVLEWRP
jgi:hypothetical protein